MAEQITLELNPSAPTLETNPFTAPTPQVLAPAPQEAAAQDSKAYLDESSLSEEEKKTVNDFSEQINIEDSAIVLQYGSACQKKVAEFSDNALEGVRTKDLGEAGKDLAALVTELKGFSIDNDEKKGLFGWLKKKGNDIVSIKARYDTADANVDKIAGVLQGHQNNLMTDIVMLDKMYEANLTYFKELTMYIIAGKKRLSKERETTLVELQKKAQESGLAEDAQKANDFAASCDRFEKKLYDLELTRTVSMQMAPQIRLLQNGDSLMVEKIQSTLNNTIPLWKNQMVLALGISRSQAALQAERAVNDYTNEMLKKNAEMLHQGTVEIAKESERGIVDIETVQHANQELMTTLDDVLKIQEEGRTKRHEAEAELGRIEVELKQKLLEIKK